MENNKVFKIQIPDGFEIDKEKSSFEKIVFKPIKTEVDSWKNLEQIEGYYVSSYSVITNAAADTSCETRNSYTKNTFATKEQAEASLALSQLSQLRKHTNGDWIPDWKISNEVKYCIYYEKEDIVVDSFYHYQHFLSFPTVGKARMFLEKHEDLILQAKPLL